MPSKLLIIKISFFFLVLINVIGFTLMGVDKNRSKKNKWRIRERTFFIISLVGGSLGTYVGMKVWHHKTKHSHFVWGIPGIFLIQFILVYLAITKW